MSAVAIAAFVGICFSFLWEAFPVAKDAFDKLPESVQRPALAVVFLAVPVLAGFGACAGVVLPGLPAVCPAGFNDVLGSLVLGGTAFLSSQGWHAIVNVPLSVGQG